MMTTINIRHRAGARAARYTTFCLLALLAVLCQSRPAQAQWATSGTNTTTTSNVGVGTAAPVTSLHVSTATTAVPRGITNEQTSADSNAALYVFRKSRAGATVQNGDNIGNLYAEAFDGAAFISPARLRFTIDGPVTANSIPTSLQFFTGTNNSGIERMRITSAGNLGIGTASPGSLLHVYNSQNTEVIGMVENANAGATAAASIEAKTNDGYAYLKMGSTAYGSWGAVGTTGTGSFYYDVFNGVGDHVWRTTASASERMRITNAGNVGIGIANPLTKLHVVGDVTVTGNIAAKYQDVAEWVPSTQKLSVGTVVVVDTRGTNQVLASSLAYDTGVAGVITGQPGLILGEEGEGKVKVATTGRVKVRVDATRAPVRAGDLLVTSEVPGVAMRSEPVSFGGVSMHRPGTIIGKALEPLEKGTGEILVLLSLQ
jgi:hypothetical protein